MCINKHKRRKRCFRSCIHVRLRRTCGELVQTNSYPSHHFHHAASVTWRSFCLRFASNGKSIALLSASRISGNRDMCMQCTWIVIEGRENQRKAEHEETRVERLDGSGSTVTRTGLERGHGDPVIGLHYRALLRIMLHMWTNCCHPSGRQRCVSHAANRVSRFFRQPGSYYRSR